MEKILSGKPVAQLVNKATKTLITQYELKPTMLLIQVGSDPASNYYVQNIINSGKKLQCNCEVIDLPEQITEQELLAIMEGANQNPDINGIMLQKPLPSHIKDNIINMAIDPGKDLDCLHPLNLGKILSEENGFLPCTPAAVLFCMQYYGINPQGKNAVILGRSNVVGKPLANMLLWKKSFANATVIVCHSKTNNIAEITQKADILIAAIGKANFVTPEMIKENAVILDVGINEEKGNDGQSIYVGDVNYNLCFDKASAITPVPGGIGRITTSILYFNLIKACLEQKNINKSIDEYLDLIFKGIH
ncbi:MAG TPA: bifunctional 5,10-methylenetetrahydrofolate dehydrogenase/5,10-methenyltetrahydrofolate cyclohydrolase [Candidatus Cloacimonas sp.]|jgi:methylenetetrahydrofolate dehydrogenase (NADP+)/methenyltetrahydrofolate cyclohydrolase|nr:bifunctional 5,10-methylenetetrahydrofolate dehydrogenase/5,10-methenyltetrahydrofolate cyclohydrolase [Candidatus Cloacimonas sp.]MDD2250064.1 bifunctional 5,10-methylenetetrahydrofolate dehydrogenase/5,10-methenyltetrahydrofolate cyclohydrolase [Candidatus Cloacimonadota bacterium]MCK9165238.1 bifunctional 5,10-methylenetetrahydrofolate dehydrogenase/5,10-methenyltetrahydrofolate cyclohydrolase [Candidatus Cloacimonas sp.]MDD3734305.1 bifunctional 5,10-methylenetetrahydrofolate dehydrogenas